MFELDYKSRLPIYEQLVERFKQLMVAQVLQPHEQLPSVRQLASQLTLNPNTIQKAYRELEHQGYTYAIPGKGSFVSPAQLQEHTKKRAELKGQIEGLLAEALYLGISEAELMTLLESVCEKIKGGASHVKD